MKNIFFDLSFDGLFSPRVLEDAPHIKRSQNLHSQYLELAGDPRSQGSKVYREIPNDLSFIKKKAHAYSKKFSTLCVLGIGGSSLGAKAVYHCFKGRLKEPKFSENLLFFENLDPQFFHFEMKKLNLKKTCFVVISKSGETLETSVQLFWVLDALQKHKIKPENHIVIISNPGENSIRAFANETGIPILDSPKNIGGRFSVFTSAGLFPLAFAGIDINKICRGAQEFWALRSDQTQDLAWRIFELETFGHKAHALWLYSTCLKEVGAWFVQLWGESLGKPNQIQIPCGLIPFAAVGSTDQHSFLQRAIEGPNNLVSGFVSIKHWPKISESFCSIRKIPKEFSKYSKLKGMTFGEILKKQAQSTEQACQEVGRPTYHLEIHNLDEASLGALLAFFMDLTVFCGMAHQLNPFTQPGVERGKHIFFDLI